MRMGLAFSLSSEFEAGSCSVGRWRVRRISLSSKRGSCTQGRYHNTQWKGSSEIKNASVPQFKSHSLSKLCRWMRTTCQTPKAIQTLSRAQPQPDPATSAPRSVDSDCYLVGFQARLPFCYFATGLALCRGKDAVDRRLRRCCECRRADEARGLGVHTKSGVLVAAYRTRVKVSTEDRERERER